MFSCDLMVLFLAPLNPCGFRLNPRDFSLVDLRLSALPIRRRYFGGTDGSPLTPNLLFPPWKIFSSRGPKVLSSGSRHNVILVSRRALPIPPFLVYALLTWSCGSPSAIFFLKRLCFFFFYQDSCSPVPVIRTINCFHFAHYRYFGLLQRVQSTIPLLCFFVHPVFLEGPRFPPHSLRFLDPALTSPSVCFAFFCVSLQTYLQPRISIRFAPSII